MQRASDRWISVTLALLLHGALFAALLYGWMLFRASQPPKPTLAIDATVIDARSVPGAQRPAPPQPPPPPPAEQGPPPPSPEELAERAKQREEEHQKEVAQKAAEEKAAEEKQAAEKAAQLKAADEARRVEDQKKAEAQKKAAQEKKAAEAAAAKQKAADEAEAAEDEADLKRSLAADERSASTGPALAKWQAQIAARIERAWIRPQSARPGISCILNVTQEPGGTVTQVKVGECNGDQAVRQSIEQAVYRASPLPPPPDPSLFERELTIHFTPVD